MTQDMPPPAPPQETAAPVLCIGSVLWDIIGRCPAEMRSGSDMPGRITRLPGGVAMNIAMTLAHFGLVPILLSSVGRDPEGDELIAACRQLGCRTEHLYRSDHLPTDRYMAVEGGNGLIAAIADAHSLEAAGEKILRPLMDGTLGSPTVPYTGAIALDGNLTLSLLGDIAVHPAFTHADLRVAPASPGKAERLRPFLAATRGTLYVNLEEAGILCQDRFSDSAAAALALIGHGAARVLVTDGGSSASEACAPSHRAEGESPVITQTPPPVTVARVTGAGDTFMAAHIAAEARGDTRHNALAAALEAAATYVSGDPPL
ncbi:PfkB family carbohydrate kinase [Pseudophaeobacter flagellatus]|uniref:PfkB family carbohydrate kinase n=1 Tax=Pseudophaeobacter flagellatus TaxID=2899119 RepID=UPI001E3FC6C7|nr:PfkB family carbohydrate kinase [Pseudophaeobacter flagellatus]MCD9150041.1 PfkB family carbohydrate kinase [Pseudophaeobacter flagellatus]